MGEKFSKNKFEIIFQTDVSLEEIIKIVKKHNLNGPLWHPELINQDSSLYQRKLTRTYHLKTYGNVEEELEEFKQNYSDVLEDVRRIPIINIYH